jgi:hypothetical protein
MDLVNKYLTEKKGWVVYGTNRKEYLAKFDYDMDFEHLSGEFKQTARSKTPLGWTKDKKKAIVYSDKGDAEIALDYSGLGKKWGSVVKV